MSCIHYKFKSSLDYNSVTFDGLHLSLADLKKAISQQKRLKPGEFDLEITNAQTGDVYKKNDELIAKNTSVIVSRVPVNKTAASSTQKSWEAFKLACAKVKEKEKQKTLEKQKQAPDLAHASTSEIDKIKAVIDQSTKGFEPSNFVGKYQSGVPSEHYICNRCQQKGHYSGNCPNTNPEDRYSEPRYKRTTGIPSTMLTIVDDPLHPGALLTHHGQFAVPTVDVIGYREVKKERPPFLPLDKDATPEKKKIPQELLCHICEDLCVDAAIAPCCGTSFCDECLREVLLESDDHKCPSCKETNVSPDKIVPNRSMRLAVTNFLNDTGYTKAKKRRSSSQNGESFYQAKPSSNKPPSPTNHPSGSSPESSPKMNSSPKYHEADHKNQLHDSSKQYAPPRINAQHGNQAQFHPHYNYSRPPNFLQNHYSKPWRFQSEQHVHQHVEQHVPSNNIQGKSISTISRRSDVTESSYNRSHATEPPPASQNVDTSGFTVSSRNLNNEKSSRIEPVTSGSSTILIRTSKEEPPPMLTTQPTWQTVTNPVQMTRNPLLRNPNMQPNNSVSLLGAPMRARQPLIIPPQGQPYHGGLPYGFQALRPGLPQIRPAPVPLSREEFYQAKKMFVTAEIPEKKPVDVFDSFADFTKRRSRTPERRRSYTRSRSRSWSKRNSRTPSISPGKGRSRSLSTRRFSAHSRSRSRHRSPNRSRSKSAVRSQNRSRSRSGPRQINRSRSRSFEPSRLPRNRPRSHSLNRMSKSRSINRMSKSRSRSRSGPRLSKVVSPIPRKSVSPLRRSSKSPPRRSPKSPLRRSSKSPPRRSPKSPLRRSSKSPPRRSSKSPPRRSSKSPPRRSSKSPLRRSSKSPLRRSSKSPIRRSSKSPIRRLSKSPLRRSSKSPLPPLRSRSRSFGRLTRSRSKSWAKRARSRSYSRPKSSHPLSRSPRRSPKLSPYRSPLRKRSFSPRRRSHSFSPRRRSPFRSRSRTPLIKRNLSRSRSRSPTRRRSYTPQISPRRSRSPNRRQVSPLPVKRLSPPPFRGRGGYRGRGRGFGYRDRFRGRRSPPRPIVPVPSGPSIALSAGNLPPVPYFPQMGLPPPEEYFKYNPDGYQEFVRNFYAQIGPQTQSWAQSQNFSLPANDRFSLSVPAYSGSNIATPVQRPAWEPVPMSPSQRPRSLTPPFGGQVQDKKEQTYNKDRDNHSNRHYWDKDREKGDHDRNRVRDRRPDRGRGNDRYRSRDRDRGDRVKEDDRYRGRDSHRDRDINREVESSRNRDKSSDRKKSPAKKSRDDDKLKDKGRRQKPDKNRDEKDVKKTKKNETEIKKESTDHKDSTSSKSIPVDDKNVLLQKTEQKLTVHNSTKISNESQDKLQSDNSVNASKTETTLIPESISNISKPPVKEKKNVGKKKGDGVGGKKKAKDVSADDGGEKKVKKTKKKKLTFGASDVDTKQGLKKKKLKRLVDYKSENCTSEDGEERISLGGSPLKKSKLAEINEIKNEIVDSVNSSKVEDSNMSTTEPTFEVSTEIKNVQEVNEAIKQETETAISQSISKPTEDKPVQEKVMPELPELSKWERDEEFDYFDSVDHAKVKPQEKIKLPRSVVDKAEKFLSHKPMKNAVMVAHVTTSTRSPEPVPDKHTGEHSSSPPTKSSRRVFIDSRRDSRDKKPGDLQITVKTDKRKEYSDRRGSTSSKVDDHHRHHYHHREHDGYEEDQRSVVKSCSLERELQDNKMSSRDRVQRDKEGYSRKDRFSHGSISENVTKQDSIKREKNESSKDKHRDKSPEPRERRHDREIASTSHSDASKSTKDLRHKLEEKNKSKSAVDQRKLSVMDESEFVPDYEDLGPEGTNDNEHDDATASQNSEVSTPETSAKDKKKSRNDEDNEKNDSKPLDEAGKNKKSKKKHKHKEKKEKHKHKKKKHKHKKDKEKEGKQKTNKEDN